MRRKYICFHNEEKKLFFVLWIPAMNELDLGSELSRVVGKIPFNAKRLRANNRDFVQNG
jgi:hypothetical protein